MTDKYGLVEIYSKENGKRPCDLRGGGTGALVVCDDPQDFGRVGTRAGPSLPSLCILTEITHYSLDPPTAPRLRRRGPAET